MKLGARILKTGIAITLALYLALLFNLPSPVFAGIAAIFAMQPSIYKTYQSILEQVQANMIGAIFAILFSIILGTDPFVIGFVSILVILINVRFKIESTIPIALVTVMAIMLTPEENFLSFALMRFFTIMIGIFSSFFVNLLFLPPKHEVNLYEKTNQNVKRIHQWIRMIASNKADQAAIKAEIDLIKETNVQAEELYVLFKEERSYFSKTKQTKKRKLVIFRQMILAMNTGYRILKNIQRYENEIYNLPDPMMHSTRNFLNELVSYHEQIMFLYEKKIRPDSLNQVDDLESLKEDITRNYIQFSNDKENTDTHLLIIIACLIEYKDHLKHLHKLVDSYHTYHHEEGQQEILSK